MAQAQQQRYHDPYQQDKQQQTEDNTLVSRVWSYPLVGYFSNTVKSYYGYVKDSNQYVKAGLETAEGYAQPLLHKLEDFTHQPPIDGILHKVDTYGCHKLDQIEHGGRQLKETYEAMKPKAIQSLDTVANKIHGTAVETVLFKTVDVVDVVVDSLLPPKPDEEPTEEEVEDPNLLEKTTPVINKLKKRVSKDSIIRLPAQTYTVSKDIIFRNADAVPQIHYCVGVLSTAAHKIHDVSASTQEAAKNRIQKGANISKQSVDHVYQSLNHMLASLTSLVVLIKRLDPIEARASLEELSLMIQRSREELSQKIERHEKVIRLKEDISRILQKAGDLLSQQLAAAHTRAQSYDNAAIRKSVESIEAIVLRIIEKLPSDTPQQQEAQ